MSRGLTETKRLYIYIYKNVKIPLVARTSQVHLYYTFPSSAVNRRFRGGGSSCYLPNCTSELRTCRYRDAAAPFTPQV